MKFQVSQEQQLIIDALQKHNVQVEAVAGSGKTTTCLEISNRFQNSQILLLTYNTRLRKETEQKVKDKGLQNIQVHTYHSFFNHYYLEGVNNNFELDKAVKLNPKWQFQFDIFIIDEAQDMSSKYNEAFLKILADNLNKSFKICTFGDKKQSIYQFNNADERFLTYSPKIYQDLNEFQWKTLQLSQSYRVTKQIANFVNNCMLNSQQLIFQKEGAKPHYLFCDTFVDNKQTKKIYNKIKFFLDQQKYKYEDIFILAPSTKSKNNIVPPVLRLEKYLTEMRLPVFCNQDDKLDQDLIQHKIVISTNHQVKGLERKVVFIYSFDQGFYRIYGKKENPNVCPNELYVAATRALEQLVLIHNIDNGYLPFLQNIENLKQYCDVEGQEYYDEYQKYKLPQDKKHLTQKQDKKDKTDISVTDLIKHLKETVFEQCFSFLDVAVVQKEDQEIYIQNKSKQVMNTIKGKTEIWESTPNIIGTAIPIYFELKLKEKSSVLEQYKLSKSNPKYSEFFNSLKNQIPKFEDMENQLTNKQPEPILLLSNLWISIQANLTFKLAQINSYDWFSQQQFDSCFDRFKPKVSQNLEFEKQFQIILRDNKNLVGFIDCIDKEKKIVWELKFTDNLKSEDKIQLGLYMKMFAINECKQIDKQKLQSLYNELSNIKEQQFEKEEELYYQNPNQQEELICKFVSLKKNSVIQFKYQNKIEEDQIQHFTKKKIRDKEKEIYELEKIADEILEQYKFYLFNIKTNEIKQVKSNISRLSKMVNLLVSSKYQSSVYKEDHIFIKEIHNSERYQDVYNKQNKPQDLESYEPNQKKRRKYSNDIPQNQKESPHINQQQKNGIWQEDSNIEKNSDNLSNTFNGQKNTNNYQQQNNFMNPQQNTTQNFIIQFCQSSPQVQQIFASSLDPQVKQSFASLMNSYQQLSSKDQQNVEQIVNIMQNKPNNLNSNQI